jgi:hypothetical protein
MKKMSENLIERVSIDGGRRILLDDKPVIEIPGGTYSMKNGINMAKVSPKGELYIGTGTCCDGYVVRGSIIKDERKGVEESCIRDIYNIPFNVNDILPVVNSEDSKEPWSFLTGGSGCSGAGIRLYGTKDFMPITKEVISENHYMELKEGIDNAHPYFRIEDGKVFLDFDRCRFRTDEGEYPTFTQLDTKGHYVIDGPHFSKDITQYLKWEGIDIEKTIERNKDLVLIDRPDFERIK